MCNCKKCASVEVRKNGVVRGKQRYKCKNCGYNFIEGDTRKSFAKPESVKQQAIQLYLLGLGFRAIGRFLGVSNVSVLNWVRQYAATQALPPSTTNAAISVMELDEMWHYCKKKEKSGFGWRFVVIANES